ncbi:hypothetical protein K2X85_12045 [bacterium]|nr:hypothetical protein [bacterium]
MAITYDVEELASFVRDELQCLSAQSEEIDVDDGPKMKALDDRYKQLGLNRTRTILGVRGDEGVMAVAVAYDGPLGMNFSFLESSCHLYLRSDLPAEQRVAVTLCLVSAVYRLNSERELPFYVFECSNDLASVLAAAGGEMLQSYSKFVIKRDGYAAFYKAIIDLYSKAAMRS